jgi:hypothetical protein
MSKGEYLLRNDKSFELSALFILFYRSLDAIVSGDEAVAKEWLNNHNTALGDAPINLMRNGQHSVNTAAPPISIGSVGAALSGGPLIGDDFL